MSLETLKIITVFIAGAFGAIIGPYIKALFEKKAEKKSAKITNRPEVYNELIYFLIHDRCSKNMDLDNLKAKILTYAKDDVIEHVLDYLETKNNNTEDIANKKLHDLIGYIRNQLKMGTEFGHNDINILLQMKERA